MEHEAPVRTSAALRKATGRDYDGWFGLLDDWGEAQRSSSEARRWLVEEHGLSRWWAQKMVVEYEQARGIRQPGARADGSFTISTSRTLAVPSDQVHAAVVDPRLRREWAPGVHLEQRTARPDRSARFDVDDGTRLNVTIQSLSPRKARIAIEQERLPDVDAAAEAKTAWKSRLADLAAHLE